MKRVFVRKNGTFWEDNGTFWEDNRTFWEPNGTFWEQNGTFYGTFWESFIFFCILPFTLVFALSFATWTFWEKKEHFEEKLNILRKKWTFWEKSGSNQNSGRALCEKPYWSSPPFCAPEQGSHTFEKFLYQFWMGFYLHTQVQLASKTWTLIEIKCKVIVSQESLVMLPVAHRKWWKQVAFACHWTHHQITASLSTCSPGETSTRSGPYGNCQSIA